MQRRTPHSFLILLTSLFSLASACAAEDERSRHNAYFDVLIANTSFSGVRVSGTEYNAPPCFLGFCNTVTAEHDARFDRDNGLGLRGGYWSRDETTGFGLAFELGSPVSLQGVGVSIGYTPFAILPMVRFPGLWVDSAARQQLDLHLGAAITLALDATVAVSFPELPRVVSGNAQGSGIGALLGIAWRLSRSNALLAEVRAIKMHLEYPAGNSISDQSAEVDFGTKQVILGVSYRF